MREEKVDYVKGIAVILMIFGHCIQFGSGMVYEDSRVYFSNKVFQLIYSFHMPLFMSLSGFYFYNSVRRYSAPCIILRKICQLLLPIFMWSLSRVLLVVLLHGSEFEIMEYFEWWMTDSFHNFWFIWAVFMLSMIVLFIREIFHDSVIVYIIVMIVLLFVPDGGFGQYKFMYPFFVSFYLLSKKEIPLEKMFFLNSWKCVVIYMGLFCVGFSFFSTPMLTNMNYCLLAGRTFGENVLQIIYKYGMGVVGSLLVLSVVFTFYKEHRVNDFVSTLGRETLGIYVMQVFVNHLILRKITATLNYNIMINVVETIVVLSICHVVIWIVDKTWLTRFLFLGKFTPGKIDLKWKNTNN